MGVPVVIGGDNLPSPVGIGLTDLPPGPSVLASLNRANTKQGRTNVILEIDLGSRLKL